MKVVFFIASLSQGGAERVVATLSNDLAKRHKVIIVTLCREVDDFYEIDGDIKRDYLLKNSKNMTNKFSTFFQIFYTIKGMYLIIKKHQPDVAVSFINKFNILSIIASKLSGTPIVVSERSNPYRDIRGTFDYLRKILYPYSDAIIFQTKGAASYFNDKIRKKSVIIHNPLDSTAKTEKQNEANIIIAMGRLELVKNYELLIESVNIIKETLRQYKWQVHIYGNGSQKEALAQLITKYDINDLVLLKGTTKSPYSVLSSAKIFALTSKYEGFPNVLCEAMANGCVPVSVDCDFGPNEIIEDNIDGLLAQDNAFDIANKIVSLVESNEKVEEMKIQAMRINKKLATQKISSQWENIFKEIQR
jgi:glycosyltransferase involved in cell wall biosynthesis